MRIKKPAFPNEQFRTQDEFFEFADKHHVYGGLAYDLKKQMDKKDRSLEPIIKPKRKRK